MSNPDASARFVGTWVLVESFSEKPSGRSPFPLGPAVTGRLHYDAQGHMAAQLMGGDRTPLSSRDPRKVPDVEYRDAFQTYTAYFGTFTVDAEAGTVIHHIAGATVPDWSGTDQVRYYRFEDGRLVLKTPPLRGNDGAKAVHTLVWRKVG